MNCFLYSTECRELSHIYDPMDMTESVERSLGRIEGKLDAALNQRDEDRAETMKLEGRIESLERFRWMIVGAASGVSALVSVVVSTIWRK